MKIYNFEQRTPEWYAIRRGRPSASVFSSIVTCDGKPSKSADKLLYKLAGEILTGKSEEMFQNDAMRRGVELEPDARMFYELSTGCTVEQIGFCLNDEETFGCSPDGLVGADGLIEIKVPSIATHISYMLDNCVPSEYYQQVQGQLLVTERDWCDFVSYHPDMKSFIYRQYRDEAFISKLNAELIAFTKRLKEIVEKLS